MPGRALNPPRHYTFQDILPGFSLVFLHYIEHAPCEGEDQGEDHPVVLLPARVVISPKEGLDILDGIDTIIIMTW
jgi:hypothetical protein